MKISLKLLVLAIAFGFNIIFLYSTDIKPEDTKSESEQSDSIIYANEITAEELKHEMETNPNLVVIHTISPRYFADCHIKGSINIDCRIMKEALTKVAPLLDKNKPIVVYCALYECDASLKAYEILMELGFTNIRAYEGGIREWFQKKFPCQGPCVQDYLTSENPEP
jgi:rhodanese-related sulfurtransferase